MIDSFWLQPATTAGAAVQEMQSINGQFWDILKMLFVLAGVLLLAWVVTKHWLPRMMGGVRTQIGPMSVVARYSLEPRKTLYIVRAGSQYLLLGCSEGQISYLTELPASSIEETPAGENLATTINFSDLLKRLGRPKRSA